MDKITYAVIAFEDATTWATFSKDGYTKTGSKRVFNKLVKSGKFDCVTRREKIEFADCSIETSQLIDKWLK